MKMKLLRIFHVLLPCCLVLPATTTHSATIADQPLFLTSSVQPNILLLTDDSGSMHFSVLHTKDARNIPTYSTVIDNQYARWNWNVHISDPGMNIEFFPDRTSQEDMLQACRGFNGAHYNPNVTYTPWPGVDNANVAYGNQSITSARENPYLASGTTQNLTWSSTDRFAGYAIWNDDGDGVFELDECPDPTRSGYDHATQFVKVNDMTAAQKTNFANWFSYYRKLEHIAKNALLKVVSDSEARMGLATLHNHGSVGTPISDMTVSTNKAALQDSIAEISSLNGTPLRQKLSQAGEYFKGTTSTSLFGSSASSPILSAAEGGACQQNFTILMSDGYWNGNDPTVGNADSDNNTSFDGGVYADDTATPASGRIVSNTLADVAMHYYETDLKPLLANEVLTPTGENTQQHLVTYTVAFGVNGTLDDVPPTVAGKKAWPAIEDGEETTIDDMRHAAFNSRGEFLSAGSPDSLATALAEAIASIREATSSSSSVATNSTRLDTNTRIYQARFSSGTWGGQLLAYDINDTTGAIAEDYMWNAADLVPSEINRNIYTSTSAIDGGVEFTWSAASSALSSAGLNEAQTNYIRGVRTGEGTTYRARASLLGDLVNSDPLYSHQENFDYYLLEKDVNGYATYDDYLIGTGDTAKGNRQAMLYIGANDGMLHALLGTGVTTSGCNPDTTACEGKEIFSYIPKAVHSGLSQLSSPSYSHRYFVDNSPKQGDAYIDFDDLGSSNKRWGTALVGTLGAGGKGVFALDISHPTGFTKDDVLWDLDNTDLAHLGYTYSQPAIVKLATGDWGVILGNGYHSDSQNSYANNKAGLYILNLETGAVISWLDTGYDGTSTRPNGLSTPIAVDEDGDKVADTVYAGDLYGNMWKFDISDSNTSKWEVAFTSGNGASKKNEPLFVACENTGTTCSDANRQPITTKPQVIRSDSEGLVVLFGTGKYFEAGDNATTSQKQTFYGIQDTGSLVDDRAKLTEQLIIEEFTAAETGLNYDTRVTTNNIVDYSLSTVRGWYLDLKFGALDGERSVSAPLVRGGRVIFATFIPDTSPCAFGGTGWLMELDAQSGSRLTVSPFDLNDDKAINKGDWVLIDTDGDGVKDTKVPVSGKKSTVGIIKTPSVIETGPIELKYTSGSSGSIEVTRESSGEKVGRQSWIQIK